ncbi:MAG: hypothetical protein OXC13_15825 [Caldilineaceae bacterium]|nr:hypothetical protein [Caldilineaceae bacterium]
MNTATYEALRKVGASEEQAVILATAIPDGEQLRADMRSELAHLEARIERRFNQQTWTIVATMVAVGGLLVAARFFI